MLLWSLPRCALDSALTLLEHAEAAGRTLTAQCLSALLAEAEQRQLAKLEAALLQRLGRSASPSEGLAQLAASAAQDQGGRERSIELMGMCSHWASLKAHSHILSEATKRFILPASSAPAFFPERNRTVPAEKRKPQRKPRQGGEELDLVLGVFPEFRIRDERGTPGGLVKTKVYRAQNGLSLGPSSQSPQPEPAPSSRTASFSSFSSALTFSSWFVVDGDQCFLPNAAFPNEDNTGLTYVSALRAGSKVLSADEEVTVQSIQEHPEDRHEIVLVGTRHAQIRVSKEHLIPVRIAGKDMVRKAAWRLALNDLVLVNNEPSPVKKIKEVGLKTKLFAVRFENPNTRVKAYDLSSPIQAYGNPNIEDPARKMVGAGGDLALRLLRKKTLALRPRSAWDDEEIQPWQLGATCTQRSAVTSNLVSTINLGQSSPLRCLRSPDPAHRRPDLRHDVLASDDFGYPNPSPQRVQFERNDRVQRQPVGAAPPPRIPSFKEALRLASTPSTSATSARSAARWEEPSESRSAAFTGLRLPAPSLPSFTNRRSLAELDLLVAEAESRIRNLELWHATPCPEVPSRFGMKSNLEECIQHAEQSLQLATKRARAIEMLRPTADAPSFASAEVGQRMQLASLRASLAQLELRFERVMSLQPGASPSPAGRPDAALGVRSELSGATSPVSPVNNVASTTNERAPPRAQCAASSRSEEDFRRLEDELQKAKIEIEELRGKNCDLERENERLDRTRRLDAGLSLTDVANCWVGFTHSQAWRGLKELKDAKAPKVEDMTEKFRQEKEGVVFLRRIVRSEPLASFTSVCALLETADAQAQFQKELEEQKTIVRSLEARVHLESFRPYTAEEAEAKTCCWVEFARRTPAKECGRDIFDAAEKGALDALRYFLRAAPQRVAQTNGQGTAVR
ncbi:unnamed protein product [Durusdinium trenchii]|uniref:Hint domain-containing protein n=1 Tax=Durusdinium trenchii TaxID=1381693 RepID=A0ABP0QK66_9DINO